MLDGIALFPPTLNLEEQGLFALGYYHQRQDFYKRQDAADSTEEGESHEFREASGVGSVVRRVAWES